jgi:hypothetical protein|tara:strand:- start:1207 stop:2073 length:867 start_codon:yes stop_codon:yes gene_type:complete
MRFGIDIEGHNGLGDTVQFTNIPEYFYKVTGGVKLIDIKKTWVFDHNPYVLRDVHDFPVFKQHDENGNPCKLPVVYDETFKANLLWRTDGNGQKDATSRSYWFSRAIGVEPRDHIELDLPRGPRLYKYEDPKEVNPTQIAIHIGPSNHPRRGGGEGRYIPKNVLERIKLRYPNYDIIQIGSLNDHESEFIDKRGAEIWETVKIIAQSAIFIGVNSGPMHIANCYPHINKKYIITSTVENESVEDITQFLPLVGESFDRMEWAGWVDHGWQYYNTKDFDIGCTYSYKKI